MLYLSFFGSGNNAEKGLLLSLRVVLVLLEGIKVKCGCVCRRDGGCRGVYAVLSLAAEPLFGIRINL